MTKTAATRITLSALSTLRPGATIWDSAVKGFCVRSRAGGALTYAVKMRLHGRQRWITIGRHGSPWTPDTARKEALRILGEATAGTDVGAERRANREAATFAEVVDRFLLIHGPKIKPQTRIDYARILLSDLVPKLGARKIKDIARADLSRLHSQMADTPRKANLMLSVVSRLMTWAAQHGFRPEDDPNPVKGLKRFREEARERYLSAAEFARLGAALDQLDGQESPFVLAALRLLILTGARLSEILTLRWQDVHLERAVLQLPDSKTGKKVVHLNPSAIAILSRLPRVQANPYVIVGRREGGRLINLQKPWRHIRRLAGLDEVRIHDLRHSFASVAAADGASLPMIGKLLGHANPQTTARYAHLADSTLHALNQRVGDRIASAMQPVPRSNGSDKQ